MANVDKLKFPFAVAIVFYLVIFGAKFKLVVHNYTTKVLKKKCQFLTIKKTMQQDQLSAS